jgi:hypothetical protein
MSPIVQKIHDIGTRTWLRFVQALNWIAVSIAGAAAVFNTMYPRAVEDLAGSLPPWAKLLVLATWAGLIHYSLRRAKVSPND